MAVLGERDTADRHDQRPHESPYSLRRNPVRQKATTERLRRRAVLVQALAVVADAPKSVCLTGFRVCGS